jgi:hypothetical protein
MVDGHAMVLSLMACALIASAVSRLLSRPLYVTLAEMQLRRIPREPVQAPSPLEQDVPEKEEPREGATRNVASGYRT